MNAKQAREIADVNSPLRKKLEPIFELIREQALQGGTSLELGSTQHWPELVTELTPFGYKCTFYQSRGDLKLGITW